MRNLFWCLTTLGSLTLSLSVGVAQERMPSNRYDPTRSYKQTSQAPATPSRLSFLGRATDEDAKAAQQKPASPGAADTGAILRYQRTRPAAQKPASPQSAAGLKNYHRELFGTAPPPAGNSAKAPARQLSTTPRPPQTNQRPVTDASALFRDSAVRPASAETQPGTRQSGVSQAAGQFKKPGSGIVQADFSQEATAPEPIRQTSGTSSAPLLPGAPSGISAESLAEAPTEAAPQQEFVAPAAQEKTASIRPFGRAANVAAATAPTGGFVNFTGNAPQIETRWTKLSDINVGQSCDLLLTVKNSGQANASDVVVDVYFPRSVRLTAASPQPVAAENSVVWKFPTLDAGEEREIRIAMIPTQRGEISANANVRFSSAATMLLAVEEPLLKLAMQGPSEVMLGESASHVVSVSNPGTGIAHNVTVEVTIPEGLKHPKGKRLKMELGSLSPGEQRSVRLSLTAVTGGRQTVGVEAASGTELRQTASSAISVLAPSLKLAVAGPALRYIGRDARYSLSLTNDGQAVTNNVRATYAVPKGFRYLAASRGGKYDENTRTVTWFVGSVSPKEAIELTLKLKPVELGDFAHRARVISEHGAVAEATADTRIEGTASLVLEVLDLDDPVEIGRETAYEVRVRNEGSKQAQNVGLSFELPNGVKLINVKGPSKHIAESGLVVFKALPVIEAGKTAVYQIHIQGADEGNHRVRARLTSDSIQEPLTVEELTRFYAD